MILYKTCIVKSNVVNIKKGNTRPKF